jgi:hypothetical protein
MRLAAWLWEEENVEHDVMPSSQREGHIKGPITYRVESCTVANALEVLHRHWILYAAESIRELFHRPVVVSSNIPANRTRQTSMPIS